MSYDEKYMHLALQQAQTAAMEDEVPIGAVLLSAEGEILAQCYNKTIGKCDPTAHAEILALREAAFKIGNYRLTGCILYTTIEPCIMCMGALIHARVGHVVFGAYDSKWGGCGSVCDFTADSSLNHRPEVSGGVMEAECKEIIQRFFSAKRVKK